MRSLRPQASLLLKAKLRFEATGCGVMSRAERSPTKATRRHAGEDGRVRDHLYQFLSLSGQHIFRVCFEGQDELAFLLSLRDTGRRKFQVSE